MPSVVGANHVTRARLSDGGEQPIDRGATDREQLLPHLQIEDQVTVALQMQCGSSFRCQLTACIRWGFPKPTPPQMNRGVNFLPGASATARVAARALSMRLILFTGPRMSVTTVLK